MRKNLKKGNTSVALLVMLLFIALLLISLYIVIDKFQPQKDVDVAGGSQDNALQDESEFKISNLERPKNC